MKLKFRLNPVKKDSTRLELSDNKGGYFYVDLDKPYIPEKSKQSSYKEWSKKNLK
jgi:hypothetical protein